MMRIEIQRDSILELRGHNSNNKLGDYWRKLQRMDKGKYRIRTMGRGMLVFGFYLLGLGVPFLVSALLLAKAYSFFNGIKRYLTPISVVSGLLLAGFGFLMVTGQITDLNRWFSELLVRLGLEGLAEV